MERKKSINELMIGDKLTDIFVLSNLSQKGDVIYGLLKNKEGEINCSFACKSTFDELKPLVGGAVKVMAIAKPGADKKIILSVKSVEKPEKSEYKSSDLFDGLDQKVIDKYISSIKKNINFIKDEFYRGLVNAIMTDEVLSGLSQYPATCSGMGTYKGGALAVTANVLEIAKQLGCAYVTLSNGLHSDNIDWSLVLTAGAIMECASKEAYTCVEPFQKTEKCIERGYGSLLQSAIEKTFYTNDALEEDSEKLSKLLNVLWCVGEQHAHISPTSKEGVLLQQAYESYKRLDAVDLFKSTNATKTESGYDWSEANKMYVSNREVVNNAS